MRSELLYSLDVKLGGHSSGTTDLAAFWKARGAPTDLIARTSAG